MSASTSLLLGETFRSVWPPLPGDDADVARSIATENPADPSQCVTVCAVADDACIDAALARARSASASWAARTTVQRSAALEGWLQRIEAEAEPIAELMTAEQGKPMAESVGEIGKALREARQMLAFAATHGGSALPAGRAGFRNVILRRPLGVTAAVTPWNFPVLTPMRKLIPALVTGNAAVLKPSEFTPGAALSLARCSDGVLPTGCLTLLLGDGSTAARLIEDERVAAVSFTGSVATGRKVAVAAAARLASVSLELGGKNGAILDDVRDLDGALDAIVGAAFQCSGQRCTSISRVIVARDALSKTVDGLRARLSSLVAGAGSQPSTSLGPITTAAQLARIETLVDEAIASGARCLMGGERSRPADAPTGRFYAPTLLQVDDRSNVAVQEEIFGPVLCLQPYDNDDEAIELLNATRFGLTSSIFTDRFAFAMRAIAEARSGMIHVNHGTVPDDNMPFVGVGDSGLGIGSVGPSTLDFYTSEHAAYLADV